MLDNLSYPERPAGYRNSCLFLEQTCGTVRNISEIRYKTKKKERHYV